MEAKEKISAVFSALALFVVLSTGLASAAMQTTVLYAEVIYRASYVEDGETYQLRFNPSTITGTLIEPNNQRTIVFFGEAGKNVYEGAWYNNGNIYPFVVNLDDQTLHVKHTGVIVALKPVDTYFGTAYMRNAKNGIEAHRIQVYPELNEMQVYSPSEYVIGEVAMTDGGRAVYSRQDKEYQIAFDEKNSVMTINWKLSSPRSASGTLDEGESYYRIDLELSLDELVSKNDEAGVGEPNSEQAANGKQTQNSDGAISEKGLKEDRDKDQNGAITEISYARFTMNGQSTDLLSEGEQYTFDDGSVLTVKAITSGVTEVKAETSTGAEAEGIIGRISQTISSALKGGEDESASKAEVSSSAEYSLTYY